MNVKNLKTVTALMAGMIIGASSLMAFSFKEPEVKLVKVPVEVSNHGQTEYKWHSPELPANLSFAGEKVPMGRADVREQLDRELSYNYYHQNSTAHVLKMSYRWFPLIDSILAANGVPADFKYLCVAESALKNQNSPVGAAGFWQFMPRTAPEYGLKVRSGVDERYNVAKATEAATKYFKQAYEKFGSWTAAAASYNMGQGGFNAQRAFQKTKDYFSLQLPEETMRYVHRILAFKLLMGSPDKYGFRIGAEDAYEPLETRTVEVTNSIQNLADFAIQQGTNYKTLKHLNPWLTDKKLTVKNGERFEIALPVS